MRAKLPVFAGVVFCAILLAGCESRPTATVNQSVRTTNDIRKAELQKELEKKWENPVALYEMGQLYHAEGDWSKAEWYYNNALGANPAYRDVQAAIVKLQFDRGDKAKGEWAANMYMAQIASSGEQLLALGIAFEKQGLGDYALKCYQNALGAAPDSYAVSRQLGYYYLTRNKKDTAKGYFIRSFQLNSNQPDVAEELGRLGVAVRIPQAPESPSESLSQPAKPPAGTK
jgi:tetratricopeptide (TPR) repeat protein